MRISDWSSDVCSSDLGHSCVAWDAVQPFGPRAHSSARPVGEPAYRRRKKDVCTFPHAGRLVAARARRRRRARTRSEEHTSELQSLMRISYAVFCLKKKTAPTLLS